MNRSGGGCGFVQMAEDRRAYQPLTRGSIRLIPPVLQPDTGSPSAHGAFATLARSWPGALSICYGVSWMASQDLGLAADRRSRVLGEGEEARPWRRGNLNQGDTVSACGTGCAAQ